MVLFGKKIEELSETEKYYNYIKKNTKISEENRTFLLTLLDRVNANAEANIFKDEKQLTTFINVIIENENLNNMHFETIFANAASLYNSLKTGGYDFYNTFLQIFMKDGLYEKGYFSVALLSICDSPRTYFDIMDIILENEEYRTNFKVMEKFLIELKLYSASDAVLRAHFINFAKNYHVAGNLEITIKEYINTAKKRAGIYDNLDENFLTKLQSATEKCDKSYRRAVEETEKVTEASESLKSIRESMDRVKRVFEESVSRTDESMANLQEKYYRVLEEEYLKLSAKITNDYQDARRALVVDSEAQIREIVSRAEKLIAEKFANIESQEISIEQLQQIKNEAQTVVNDGLSEIKNLVQGIGLENSEDLKKLSEILRNYQSTGVQVAEQTNLPQSQIVVPNQTIVTPTNIINTGSIRSVADLPPVPPVIADFDKSRKFKKRYMEIMDRKKRAEDKGEVFNEIIDDVINVILENGFPYLTGPSGSGKSYFVEQLGNLFDLKVVDIGYIVEEYEIIGGKDANGNYSSTPFFNCWHNGHIAFLDEIDNSVPSATLKYNSFMKNTETASYCFPVIGFVNRHPNFRIIAAGNTNGMGGSSAYRDRSKLDESIQQRLTFFDFGFDENVEKAIVGDYSNWYEFIKLYRAAVDDYHSGMDSQGQFTTRDLANMVRTLENDIWDEKKIIKYQFVESKPDDYLTSISEYMKKNDSGAKTETKKLIKIFDDLCGEKHVRK